MNQTMTESRELGASGVETGSFPQVASGRAKPPSASIAFTNETSAAPAMRPTMRSASALPLNPIDRSLLRRAAVLLEDVEHQPIDDQAVALESLRNVAFRLWTSAERASIYHRSVLAMVESFLSEGRESVSGSQAAALRGAVKDLSLDSIGEQHAKVIRSQFIDSGQKPLSMFGRSDTGGG